MGQGSNVTLGSSDSADSAATHDCEARFLNNFLHLANRAHFRVLNVGELEAAFADDFLVRRRQPLGEGPGCSWVAEL